MGIDIYDPDIDGPENPPLRKARPAGAHLLLVGIAFMSLVWAGTSIYLFVREEQARRSDAHHLNTPEILPHRVGLPAPRPLLALVPYSVREKGIPGSEISLAADMRAADERGEAAALWKSNEWSGARPDNALVSVPNWLLVHAQPGRKIDGWVMQVGWPFRIDSGMDPKYILTQGPPGYRVTLRLPENLAGRTIWLSGYNYDSKSKEFALADRYFEDIKPNDWVRVSGVLRPGSRIEWRPGKPDDELYLGEMTISDIQRVEVAQK